MSGSTPSLEDHCRQVTASAASAIEWLRIVGPRISASTEVAEQELRRIGFRAERLRQAATRPINVGMFGGSQSGKSYLAAALSRNGAAPLRIKFGDERLDYFSQINPARSPKSSACVTRFSVRAPDAPFPEAPVSLRLLSQSDVVRIIANSYLEDVDPEAASPTTPPRLALVISRLRTQVGEERSGFSADDVDEMRSYFERYFHRHPVVAALGDNFWTAAAEMSDRMSIQGRAVMFSLLWGETPQLTVMCVRLFQALEALGNSEVAFCGLEALDPTAMSIIDTDTMLHGLEEDSSSKITLFTPGGHQVAMTRPLVTALTAELNLTLEEQPYAFFGSADLLDFPGAPARMRFTEPDTLYPDPANRARHFRRGKAAYLFQRYVAAQELTALVLCMEDTPPIARTLPEMVREWIDAAQGATPEERQDIPCALFVALTKFDQELKEELRHREDDPEHWEHRLSSVFNEFLCRDYRWYDHWAPRRAFNNVFWIRNPVIPEAEILQYNATGRETGWVDRARVARLRSRFLASPVARDHFSDAMRAWDEVVKLNDGGVSYLAGQLRPVCDQELRHRQFAELLAALAREMHQCLGPFHSAVEASRAAQPPRREPPAATAAPSEEPAVSQEIEEEVAREEETVTATAGDEPAAETPDTEGLEEPEVIPAPRRTSPSQPAADAVPSQPAAAGDDEDASPQSRDRIVKAGVGAAIAVAIALAAYFYLG